MSQEKNSESAKLNAIKRNLTIALNVLGGEHETFMDCLEDGPDRQIKAMLYSIENVMEYLQDVRNDCNEKVTEYPTKAISNYIYSNVAINELVDYIESSNRHDIMDAAKSDTFDKIDLVYFMQEQDLIYKLQHKILLTESEITHMINAGYIHDEIVEIMMRDLHNKNE